MYTLFLKNTIIRCGALSGCLDTKVLTVVEADNYPEFFKFTVKVNINKKKVVNRNILLTTMK
jgi:hypothetical protein